MNGILETGISTGYVKDWTVTHALREIIQNWIDVRNQYDVSGSVTWKAGTVTVKDRGPGMELRHLAIGISEKAEGSIGQFGEGLKLAFLVLAREGRKVELWTKGQVIRPKVALSEGYGVDTLQFEIRPMKTLYATRFVGTAVKVECTETELETGKSYFACFRSREKSFTWMEKGKISSPGGQVFVNGASVGKLSGAVYSYHLVGPEAEDLLNRDRDTVDMSKLVELVGDILAQTSSRKVMWTLLRKIVQGEFCWEFDVFMRARTVNMKNRIRLWKRAWNVVASQNLVLGCSSTADRQAEYRGHQILETIPYAWRTFLETFVPRSDSLVSSARPSVGHVAQKDLTARELSTLRWAKRTVRKCYHNPGAVSVVTNLDAMAGMAVGLTANGVYSPKNDRIYLRRNVLTSRWETLHTLLHETVHKVSGAGDWTTEFERALLDVAVGMMAGRIDR